MRGVLVDRHGSGSSVARTFVTRGSVSANGGDRVRSLALWMRINVSVSSAFSEGPVPCVCMGKMVMPVDAVLYTKMQFTYCKLHLHLACTPVPILWYVPSRIML